MSFQFTCPHWLWLLLPAGAWVLWLTRASDVQIHPVRRALACAVRLLVAGAIVLALAGLQWLTPIEGMNVFFALDRSDSIPAPQQEAARQWVNQVANDKQPGDRAGVVVFGTEASIEASATPALDLQQIRAVVPTERSDLASAIRLASAAFPEFGQRRIVLVTDGNENLGDALNAALSARAMEVNVDVVPIGGEQQSDVSIQRVQLPSHVRKGQSFEAKVFVQADEPGSTTVRLYRNEQYLGEQVVRLEAGKNLLTFPQALPESGFYNYEVRLDVGGDRVPQNNRAFAFTEVRGVPRVLIVSSDPAADAPLAAALRSPELEARVTGVEGFPGSLAELQSYDSIVLCNVSAGDLGRAQQSLLESAVRDFGTGFVCVGGDQTYAAGAYRGTPLANILPVEVELSSQKVLPPGALVLVIDRSGSMTGDKLDMAKEGAAAAVLALAAGDYVGVIAFDGEPHVVVDIQPAGDHREILRRILSIGEGGGTVMYPALAGAHEMLRRVTASFKHCVVLTDGVSAPGDFEGLTRAMAADRITVSTVGIGQEIDGHLLRSIAATGHGRFYPVAFPSQLPQIFVKETAVVLKSAINEEPFTPQRVAITELVRGISAAEFPPLLGYVVTEPKPRAEAPLLTAGGDPLLAHWQYGLGRAVAFTSDAKAQWARHWVGWARYRQFWRQVVHWSLRRLENADLAVAVTTEHGEGRVSVEAIDPHGNFQNLLHLQGTVFTPAGERQTVRLRQTGPGHYEATFPMRESGAYLLHLVQLENGQVRAAQVVGASLNYSPELDASGPNLNLLRRIAEATGGKVLDPTRPGSNPFYDDRRTTWQPHDLWESLLKLAIVLFVLDGGLRRVDPDPEQIQKAWRAVLGVALFWRRTPPAAPPADALLATLLNRRDEVRAQRAPRTAGFERDPHPPKAAPVAALQSPATSRLGPSRPDAEPEAGAAESGNRANTTSHLLEAKRRARARNL